MLRWAVGIFQTIAIAALLRDQDDALLSVYDEPHHSNTYHAGEGIDMNEGLKEYCSGIHSGLIGKRIHADWLGFGAWHVGIIKAEPKPGLYTILYVDGYMEKKVPTKRIKELQSPDGFDPKKDPACVLQSEVESLKVEVDKGQNDAAIYVASRRSEKTNDNKDMNDIESDIDDGKRPSRTRRSAKDRVEGLGKKMRNARLPFVAPLARLTKKRVSDSEMKESTKKNLEEGRAEAEAFGADGVSEKVLEDDVSKISSDIAGMEEKADQLEKTGNLDDELKTKIENLVSDGKEVKAVGEILKATSESTKMAKEVAEENVVVVAKKMANILEVARKETASLDRDVIPSDWKWWRFRYENLYVNAIVFIIISGLYAIYCMLLRSIRRRMRKHESAAGTTPRLVRSLTTSQVHEALASHPGQMAKDMGEKWTNGLKLHVCAGVAVFLTMKLVGRFLMMDEWIPLLPTSKGMHLPEDEEGYLVVGLEACLILLISVVIYYFITYALVRCNQVLVNEWYRLATLAEGSVSARTMQQEARLSHWYNPTTFLVGDVKEFSSISAHLSSHAEARSGLQRAAADSNEFCLFVYLSRRTMEMQSAIIDLSHPQFWFVIMLTFFVLMLLNSFCHISWAGPLSLVVVLFIVGLIFVHVATWRAIGSVRADVEAGTGATREFSSMESELIIFEMLRYIFFMLCFGVANILCRGWMWDLYFFPCLGVMVAAMVGSAVFVYFVAPCVPLFTVAMSLPPYVGDSNLETLKSAMDVKKDQPQNP